MISLQLQRMLHVVLFEWRHDTPMGINSTVTRKVVSRLIRAQSVRSLFHYFCKYNAAPGIYPLFIFVECTRRVELQNHTQCICFVGFCLIFILTDFILILEVHFAGAIIKATIWAVASPRVAHSSLHWRPIERPCVSNHRQFHFLFNHFFRRTSKKFTKNSRHWSLRGDWWPADSPHKGPVTREMISFDDVIMYFQEPPSAFCTIGGPHHHGFNWGSRFWHSWTHWTRIMRYCLHGIGNCCDMFFVGNSWNLFQIDS